MTTLDKPNEFQLGIFVETFLSQTIKITVSDLLKDLLPQILSSRNENTVDRVKWISRKEVAQKFGISLPTVDDHAAKGTLKAYAFGKRILFNEIEIDNAPVPFASLLKSHSTRKKTK
jgi:excisionase family DNA binding protein